MFDTSASSHTDSHSFGTFRSLRGLGYVLSPLLAATFILRPALSAGALMASGAGPLLLLVGLLIYGATGVVWLVWSWWAHANLKPLGVAPRVRRHWVLAGWLVPLVNVFMPHRVTSDLRVETDPTHRGRASSSLVTVWWVLYLASNLSWIVQSSSLRPVRSGSAVDLVAALVHGAAAVAAARLVFDITHRHHARHAAIVGDAPEAIEAPAWRRWALTAAGLSIGWLAVVGAGQAVEWLTGLPGDAELVVSLPAGTCADRISDDADAPWVQVVPCSESHDLEVLGRVEALDEVHPGDDVMFEFTAGRCTGIYEVATGKVAAEADLYVFVPDAVAWRQGERSGACVVSPPGGAGTGSMVTETVRAPLWDLNRGGCYEISEGFETLQEAACGSSGLVVSNIEWLDSRMSAGFPGESAIGEQVDKACGSNPEMVAVFPSADSWRFGDRVIVCARVLG